MAMHSKSNAPDASRNGGMEKKMEVQKVLAALGQIEAAIASGRLTEAMAHNAMVNLDRATPCFGKAAGEWKKVIGFEDGHEVVAPYTIQDLSEFVANKREMFAAHPYMLERE